MITSFEVRCPCGNHKKDELVRLIRISGNQWACPATRDLAISPEEREIRRQARSKKKT